MIKRNDDDKTNTNIQKRKVPFQIHLTIGDKGPEPGSDGCKSKQNADNSG